MRDRLVKSLKTRETVTTNRTVPGEVGGLATLRPDIVIPDDVRRRVIVIDVTVPFENRMVAFDETRQRKVDNYHLLVESLRGKSYTVEIDAFVVGSFGGWDWQNERIIKLLNINRVMRR